MAVFYPPPLPFIGGKAPLVPSDLPPQITAVRVDNPPFASRQRTALYVAIRQLWEPAPPNPFIGGWQPLDTRNLPPALVAVRVDNPPFISGLRDPSDLQAALLAWRQPAYAPFKQKFVPQPASAAVIGGGWTSRDPVFASIFEQHWRAKDPYQQRRPFLIPQAVATGLVNIGSASGGSGGGTGLSAVGSAG